MTRFTMIVGLAAASLGMAAPVQAQGFNFDPDKLLLGVDAGFGKFTSNDWGANGDYESTVRQVKSKPVHSMFRINVGYDINDKVGVEVGFAFSGEASAKCEAIAEWQSYAGECPYTTKQKYSGLDVAAILKPALLDGKVDLPDWARGFYARVGLINYKSYGDIKNNGTHLGTGPDNGTDHTWYWYSNEQSESGFALHWGLGYQIPVGPGFARVNWTYMPSIGGNSAMRHYTVTAGYVIPLGKLKSLAN